MAANQETTREWWANRRDAFEIFVSQTVIKESSAGDPDAAQRRLEILQALPRLDITDEVESLAATLIAVVPLPPQGTSGCPPHCRRCRPSHELPADLELHAYRECDPAISHRICLPGGRVRAASGLHATRNA